MSKMEKEHFINEDSRNSEDEVQESLYLNDSQELSAGYGEKYSSASEDCQLSNEPEPTGEASTSSPKQKLKVTLESPKETIESQEEGNSSRFPEEDPKVSWKNIQGKYDDHYEEKISHSAHRGDLTSTIRLLGYTDAMMATCATFLVIPIRHKKHAKIPTDSLSEFLEKLKLEVVMFFLGFLIVCTIWESINIRALVVKHLDDLLVLLSILSMLITTVIPFAILLQGNFPGDKVTIILTTLLLLSIEFIEVFIVYYAFASQKLLHVEMRKWQPKNIKRIRNALLKKSFVVIIFISVAALFEFINYQTSWAVLSLLILNPLLRKGYLYWRRRNSKPSDEEHSGLYIFLTKGNIPKERIEVFTDAAVAIIACVLILDITIEEFPKLQLLKSGQVWSEVQKMKNELYTFFGAYILVSLLWYVNHTIIHLYHTINVTALYTQKLFLCFLSLMPLSSNIVNDFSFKAGKDDSRRMGIRVGAIIVFLASICNVFLLIFGIYRKEKLLHKWALHNKNKRDRFQHLYVILKVANMPFWSAIVFFGSFASSYNATFYVFITCFLLMLVSFICVKFVFVNHIDKNILHRRTINKSPKHNKKKKGVEEHTAL